MDSNKEKLEEITGPLGIIRSNLDLNMCKLTEVTESLHTIVFHLELIQSQLKVIIKQG